ncbi:hypothetical protein BDA99DRAFT_556549 [Phascolomyces articulosus]|uniref:F-box domain-containing protein n=1 Tax=Phascolomyces articulosus TaxID=60185 RepID=A0AAD5K836_9FUNG|nr:hypothetical protein BDA99DRAFT_556549 [Phascolomyces articulosus]
MSLLDVRAWTYGTHHQINQGLKDAYQMITYSPTTPSGYLRAGSLYVMDNRYKAALEVYEQGIEAITAADRNNNGDDDDDDSQLKDSAERKILQEKYDEAKLYLEKTRVDFVARLPSDVLCQVLDYLPFNALLETLNVSKIWREHVIAYPNVWTKVKLATRSDNNHGMLGAILVRQYHYGHHVKHVSVDDLCEDDSYDVFIEFIYGAFSNLESLDFWSSDMDGIYEDCIAALSRIKDTLRSLRFSLKARNLPLPLGAVLAECKNLIKFDYLQPCTITPEALDDLPSTPIYSLNDLTLACAALPTPQLERILQCCPRLLQLACMNCDTSAIEIIQRLCPHLYSLGLNSSPHELSDEEKKTLLDNMNQQDNSPHGIHHINFDVCSAWQSMDHDVSVLRILLDNAHVLETAEMRFGGYMDDDEHQGARWDGVKRITLPRLRSLYFEFNPTMSSVAAALLSNCPSLETLALGPRMEFIDDEVFRSIARLRNLKELTISFVSGVDETGLAEVFQAFGSRGKSSSLQKVKLDHCISDISEEAAQYLAEIQTLHEIHLIRTYMSLESFEKFAKTLAHQHGGISDLSTNTISPSPSSLSSSFTSSLHTIVLEAMDCVTDESVRYLHEIPSLRNLELLQLRNVTPSRVQPIEKNNRITLKFDDTHSSSHE